MLNRPKLLIVMAGMLELSQKILTKVSFDPLLFQKEYRKALVLLKPNERMLLRVWALATFGSMYRQVILDVYRAVIRT
jgi:hypothetical protein